MANMIVNSSNGLGADAVHGGSMVDARHPSGNHHGLGLLALAAGAFVLGAAEFVMMGILPQAAQTMHVSIPFAGNFISAYAIGVCVARSSSCSGAGFHRAPSSSSS